VLIIIDTRGALPITGQDFITLEIFLINENKQEPAKAAKELYISRDFKFNKNKHKCVQKVAKVCSFRG
jgi:hypothetical protein